MSLKYKEGDLLINTNSGCMVVVTNGESGDSRWITESYAHGDTKFHTSFSKNSWNIYSDYAEGDFKVLGNICTLSENIFKGIKNGTE